jgi:hypothetical protein
MGRSEDPVVGPGERSSRFVQPRPERNVRLPVLLDEPGLMSARQDGVVHDIASVPLTWKEIVERLSGSDNVWLHTTNSVGAPEAVPVWVVVIDETAFFYSQRSTVKARNLARDSRALLHLESGSDVVIIHGRLDDLGRPGDVPAVVEAFARKYDQPEERQFLPSSDPAFDVLYRLVPQRALSWTLPDSDASMRRWSLP